MVRSAEGIIIKAVAGIFEIAIPEIGILPLKAPGRFRYEQIKPMVGDRVAIHNSSGEYIIDSLQERINMLERPPIANITALLILAPVCKPVPDLLLIDQLICRARYQEIRPILCINKFDLDPQKASELREEFRGTGITCILTSPMTGQGMPELKGELQSGICCLCGQSAAGKSSLANHLLGAEAFETGGLSRKIDRGRHTTRHCELKPLPSGAFLADTPGFSRIDPLDIPPEELRQLYPEFDEYAQNCRFHACMHQEEPDCGVRTAVQAGLISAERWERYRKIALNLQENWRRRYD